ncbi:hypothetical protein DVH05_014306 [Phytophthora capsici]|nr:hypothetical protein DVH05_014306 [Phytophthora capsici]
MRCDGGAIEETFVPQADHTPSVLITPRIISELSLTVTPTQVPIVKYEDANIRLQEQVFKEEIAHSHKEIQRVRVQQHAWGTPVTNLGFVRLYLVCGRGVRESAHRKTAIFLANESRAPEVRVEFMRHLDAYFQWKEVPKTERDADYLREAIEVFEMKPKKRKAPLE